MDKTIWKYGSILLVNSLFSAIVGMNRDEVISQLVRKEIIPMLALNNYVVNVPTAYQALKKEASLPYIALEKNRQMLYRRIEDKNHFNRLRAQQKGMRAYPVDVSELRDRIPNKARNFYSKAIEISFYSCCSKPTAFVRICTGVQCVSLLGWEYQAVSIEDRDGIHVGCLQKDELCRLMKNSKSLVIELYSPGNLSDWIKITNNLQ